MFINLICVFLLPNNFRSSDAQELYGQKLKLHAEYIHVFNIYS